MTFVKLDDRFDDNRKTKRAWRQEPAAIGLFAQALSYTSRHNTDGVLDSDWIAEKLSPFRPAQRKRILEVLVAERLFDPLDSGDFAVHDYLDWNFSSAERERLRRAGQKGAEARWGTDGYADRYANRIADGNAIRIADGNAMGNANVIQGKARQGKGSRYKLEPVAQDYTEVAKEGLKEEAAARASELDDDPEDHAEHRELVRRILEDPTLDSREVGAAYAAVLNAAGGDHLLVEHVARYHAEKISSGEDDYWAPLTLDQLVKRWTSLAAQAGPRELTSAEQHASERGHWDRKAQEKRERDLQYQRLLAQGIPMRSDANGSEPDANGSHLNANGSHRSSKEPQTVLEHLASLERGR